MIHSLRVENIALIDSLQMEFADGLNVLSGETGAGKSIIVDSMNLALGERADREMIRSGTEKARVEAVLYVDKAKLQPVFEQFGIEPDDELIVIRELSVSGKNVCRINGNAVNLSTLKSFMDNVVDLLGQHEHQSLLYSVNHLELTDDFGKQPVVALKEKIAQQYAALHSLEKQLASLGGDTAERMQKTDLLRFQIDELEKANLREDELDELKQEREVLQNAQEISEVLNKSYQVLYLGGDDTYSVLSGLKSCIDEFEQIAAFDPTYGKIVEELKEHYYALEDTAQTIGSEAESIVFDAARQDEVEERIEFLNGLKRKYNAVDMAELMEFAVQAQEQLSLLEDSEKTSARLSSEIEETKKALYSSYQSLHDLRETAAQELSKKVVAQLRDLGMKDGKFEARFARFPSPGETIYSKAGPDFVEFYISTNAGEPLKPLIKTASGGEISRIMLAFKSVAAGMDKISTMIFDEIDTGISGQIAHVVAEKMAAISLDRQVVCVTHLPQIAAMADRNFLITKASEKGTTNTMIRKLSQDETVQEITRLSGGMQTANATAYAKELLENAKQIKNGIRATRAEVG